MRDCNPSSTKMARASSTSSTTAQIASVYDYDEVDIDLSGPEVEIQAVEVPESPIVVEVPAAEEVPAPPMVEVPAPEEVPPPSMAINIYSQTSQGDQKNWVAVLLFGKVVVSMISPIE